ncbi:MAG TPA: 2-phospho-L-lactate transferase [Acidimicrobiales bacterium]|nr:2-phospho-L-lactate transferase [Acidimicrobiales bacterium]
MIVALAGGVGAARLLTGVVKVADPRRVTAVVNTGDDAVLHGLSISPDLDTVTYTLAGAINPDTGWGRAGETWGAMAELGELSGGRLAWFNLGDRDLGTHLYRTARLAEGATLSAVTTEIASRWGIAAHLVPMTDRRVATRVTLASTGEEIGFQEYFVGHRHAVAVSSVRFDGVEEAMAAPGVLDAIAGAEAVVICPSNPIVSIGPILAVPGVADAVMARRDDTVAVSPIIAGKALKGPADRMLAELGHEVSVIGVARLWAPFAATLVVDDADAARRRAVEAEGVRCVVAPTVMKGQAEAEHLARTLLRPRPTAVGQ